MLKLVQVSHISTSCEYHCDDQVSQCIPEEWAVSQIKSSVDYAHGSWLTTFMSGALNYQVTHHLFPSISQVINEILFTFFSKSNSSFSIIYLQSLRLFVNYVKNMESSTLYCHHFWKHLKLISFI